MEDWKERVREERKELADKLTKLTAFISRNPDFKGLHVTDRVLLRRQRETMSEYCDVLDKRIARF